MAEEIICPVCDAPNDAANELCVECGAELPLEETDADEPQDFDEVEQENAYEDQPDYGVDADEEAFGAEQADDFGAEPVDEEPFAEEEAFGDEEPFGDESFDEEPFAEEESFGEDLDQVAPGREQIASHETEAEDDEAHESVEYELEPIEPGDEDFADEEMETGDAYAHDRALFDDEGEEFADELQADGGAVSEPILDEKFGSEVVDDADSVEEEPDDDDFGVADEPPELDAILNPEHVDREPIEPLPTPGPYQDSALLTVVSGGEVLGEVAVDDVCTVLGVGNASGGEEAAEEIDEEVEPIEVDAADLEYELEVIPEDEDEDEGEFLLEEESDFEETSEAESLDEDSFDDESFAEQELEEESSEVASVEEPEDGIEEGPLVDLGQYGDAEALARRHAYLFKHNKHFTLYVLSDRGTQVNDELLALGDYRELSDGDVIILGGELALRFEAPAA